MLLKNDVEERDDENSQHVETCNGGPRAGHVAFAGWLIDFISS